MPDDVQRGVLPIAHAETRGPTDGCSTAHIGECHEMPTWAPPDA